MRLKKEVVHKTGFILTLKIWIHAVWGTKNRYPYLTKEIKQKVIEHIKITQRKKNYLLIV